MPQSNSHALFVLILILSCGLTSAQRKKGMSLGLTDINKPSKLGPGIFFTIIMILLFAAYAYDSVPPITVTIICAFIVIHSRFFTELDLSINSVCMDPKMVMTKKQYYRLVSSTFYHANDLHLIISMTSFIGKAASLEECFGSDHFLVIFFMLALVVNLISIPVVNAASYYLGTKTVPKCIIGINFAMQTITSTLYGNKAIASWIELPIMSFLLPKTTLALNFAGVFAGLLGMIILDYISRLHSHDSGRCCGRPSCSGNGGVGGPCAKTLQHGDIIRRKGPSNENGCRSTTACKSQCKVKKSKVPCNKCGHTGCVGGCGTGYGGFGGGNTLSRKHWFWTGVHGY